MIKKRIDIDINEVLKQLNINLDDLQSYIENRNTIDKLEKIKSHLFIFCIEEYITYLKELIQLNRFSKESFRTYDNFLLRVKNEISISNPDLVINDFSPMLFIEILKKIAPEELSNRTTNKYYAIIRALLKFAYYKNYLSKDISNKFELTTTTVLPKYIKDEELRLILNSVENISKPTRNKTIILFLLYTGCRVSEIAEIRVKDFNIIEDLIFINNAKGNKDRLVPMPPKLKKEVLDYLMESGLSEWSYSNDGYLFSKDQGNNRSKKLTIRTFERVIETIRKVHPELNHITTHQFRHTYAVNCLKNGMPYHLLAQIMGHENINTTMVYTKLYSSDLQEIVNHYYPFPFEKLLEDIINEEGNFDEST